MQRMAFFGKLANEHSDVKEAGWGIVFPSVILGAIIIAVGLLFPFIWKWRG